MHRTKLKLTFVGLGILCSLALAFILKGQFDSGLWMAWFGAFAMVLGIYASANVAQKGVMKKNGDQK